MQVEGILLETVTGNVVCGLLLLVEERYRRMTMFCRECGKSTWSRVLCVWNYLAEEKRGQRKPAWAAQISSPKKGVPVNGTSILAEWRT